MPQAFEVTISGNVSRRKYFDINNHAQFLSRDYANAVATQYRNKIKNMSASEMYIETKTNSDLTTQRKTKP